MSSSCSLTRASDDFALISLNVPTKL